MSGSMGWCNDERALIPRWFEMPRKPSDAARRGGFWRGWQPKDAELSALNGAAYGERQAPQRTLRRPPSQPKPIELQ